MEEKPPREQHSSLSPMQSASPSLSAPDSANPLSEKIDELIIPDGGGRAYASALGGWLVTFCTFGFASSFGVFEDYYVSVGASTSSNVSWIGSLQLFFLFFMGLPAGKLFDDGYFHPTTAVGSLLCVFSMMMLSLADPRKYYQLVLAQGVGIGLGGGLILVPALSVQSHHWRRHRSLVMGIVLTGSSCGGIVYPIMLNQLFYNGVGFAWAVRAAAFMTLGMLFIANFVLTTRLPSLKDRKRLEGVSESSTSIKSIFTDVPYMITNLGAFLGLLGVFLPYFYLQLFVNAHGLSNTLAFYTIAILNAASIIGRTIPSAAADRLGSFTTLVPVWFCTGSLVFVMFAATTPGGVIVFSIFYGIFSGAFIALLPPLLASMARSPEEVGTRIGFGYCFCSLAMLTGTPIDGALLGNENTWSKAIIFSGVVMLAGTTLIFIARAMIVKRKGTWRT